MSNLDVNSIFPAAKTGQEEFFQSQAAQAGVPNFVGKTADETVTSTSAYHNDTELFFGLETQSVYNFVLTFGVDNESSDPDFKFTIAGPTGSEGKQEVTVWENSDVDGVAGIGGIINYADLGLEEIGGKFRSSNVLNEKWFRVVGWCKTGASGGNLQFRWGPENSDNDDCTVLAGANLEVTKR